MNIEIMVYFPAGGFSSVWNGIILYVAQAVQVQQSLTSHSGHMVILFNLGSGEQTLTKKALIQNRKAN
jgi:hypothetical protein